MHKDDDIENIRKVWCEMNGLEYPHKPLPAIHFTEEEKKQFMAKFKSPNGKRILVLQVNGGEQP